MAFTVNIIEVIGRTPLIRINKVTGEQCAILAKYEAPSPGGPMKDRPVLMITHAAQASRALRPGGTIVKATSGNTGAGLAMVGTALGHQVVIAILSSMNVEQRELVAAFGTKLLLTAPADGMQGAKATARKYLADHPGSIYAAQFDDSASPDSHYRIIGPETWEQTGGRVDVFITGVGSARTITGVGRFLKEHNPQVQVVVIELIESSLLTTGNAGSYRVQGIGTNSVPGNSGRVVANEFLTTASDRVIETAREVAAQKDPLMGTSSGANLAVAAILAARPENVGRTIVTVLPDTDERYLSTVLFEGVGKIGK